MKSRPLKPSLDEYNRHRTNYKVEDVETKLVELRSALSTLGKEAALAMIGVENQQQKHTLEHLVAMVCLISTYAYIIVKIGCGLWFNGVVYLYCHRIYII